MKRKILFNILAIIILTLVLSPFFISSVFAQGGSEAKLESPLGTDDIKILLVTIIDNVVIKIGTIVAVMFLIYSGYLFVEARGNESKVTKARETFTWTIVGIAVLLGAKAIAMIVTKTIESVSGGSIHL